HTGKAERLTTAARQESHAPESWSAKDQVLLFTVTKSSDVSLWTFSLRDHHVAPFGDVHSINPIGAVFSPDGRWVAYTTTDRGRTNTYVEPYPPTGAKYSVVTPGSPHHPLWSPDGKTLFYNPRAGAFEAVSVT